MKKAKKTKIIENKKFKTRKKPKLFEGSSIDASSKQEADALVSGASAINPIVGGFMKVGQEIGSKTMDQNGLYDSRAGAVLDNNINPTTGVTNFKDLSKNFNASTLANQLTAGLIGTSATQQRRKKEADYRLKVANAGTAEQIQRSGLAKGGYVFGDTIGGDTPTGKTPTGKTTTTASNFPFTIESWKKQGVLDSLNRGTMLKGSYADFNKHFGVSIPQGANPTDLTYHINPVNAQPKGKPVMFNTVTGQTVTHDKMGQNTGGLMTFKKGGKLKRKKPQIDPFLDDGQEGKFAARFGGPVPMNQQKAFYTWMLGETCDEDYNTKGEQRTHLDPDREAYPDKGKKASGGKLLANKLGVIDGGGLQPVSNDAVEVKADNPQAQDSVELQDAFVDDGEIIDRKNRVFSEALGYAKQAKKLEKQKSKSSRFSEANERIEQKLDALFQHQEQSKKQGLTQSGGRKKEALPNKERSLAAGGKYRPTEYKRKSSDEVNIGGRVKLKKFDPTVRMKDEDKVHASYGTELRMRPEDDLRGKFSIGGELNKSVMLRNQNRIKDKMVYGGENEDLLASTKGVDLSGLDRRMTKQSEDYKKFKMSSDKSAASFLADKKAKRAANLKTAGNMLATYGPNIASAILQGKLKGPAAPSGEGYKALDRIRPDAQLAGIERDSLAANQGVKVNTAQAGDIASGYGMILGKKLAAQNEVYGQNQALNAQIQHQEAGLNVGINQRNTDRLNNYRQSVNDFSNLKTRLTSENIANVGQKYMLGEREKNQMDLDKFKFSYAQKQFEDSGVGSRAYENATPEEQAVLKKYGYGKKDGGKLHGHYLNRSRERDELAKGGKIHIKPENRGKFTATKKATGKTTEELKHSKNPLTRRRATFAANAKQWAKKKKK